MEEQREEDILQVEDAMQKVKGPVLESEQTLEQALQKIDQNDGEHWLVRLSPSGWNVVSKEQLTKMAAEEKGASTLGSLLPILHVPMLHPDHPLETALRYMDRWPLLPVVSRADFRQLEGVISERDVLARYREFGEG